MALKCQDLERNGIENEYQTMVGRTILILNLALKQ